MTGKFLLDTNIIIALLADEHAIKREFVFAAEVFVPIIAISEFYYGAQKSSWSARNIARIDTFTARNSVLLCDIFTTQQYGITKNVLRAKGRPIPENDIWIAALALQHHLTLATRDTHFNEVNGLSIAHW